MSNLIDKQAAIDLWDKYHPTIAVDAMQYDTELRQLPPAQPEPCEDAVSRKAVKDGFVEMCSLLCPYTEKQRHIMCGSCLLGTAFDVLEATQPVTPKQPEQHIDADGTLWITITDIEQVKRVIVDEEKSKFCRQFYMDAKPEQRTDLLKAEIKRMKRSFTTCINSDYYTGYMSALSAVEGYIAQWEGDAE